MHRIWPEKESNKLPEAQTGKFTLRGGDSLSGFDGFIIMPQCLFVSRYGLDNFDVSINALYEMTKRFTAEGDIRPYALMIDTVIHYMKANGRQKAKVFKAAKKRIDPGETISITKTRSFKPINTRPYYAGQHALEIQINGKRHAWTDFTLLVE